MSSRQGESDRFFTASGIPLHGWYGPGDVPAESREAAAGPPGVPPYLRGAYPGMYRTKPWRVFQLSGHGNPEDERERIKFLLNQGETGFIMEHDRNTADHLYNVDHPEVVARREDVGQTGAVIQSVRDYETVLDGIDMSRNYAHPGGAVVQHAPFALGCYWMVAQRRGLDLSRLAGTGQSDFFLTYLGCIPKRQIPTAAGIRLNTDIIEFCGQHLPRWVPVSIAAYNAADTGLNAYQELAALFANAVVYLDEIKRRAPENLARLAYMVGGINLRVSMDFFEDICKMRAARKMWADLLGRRYGITDERATRMRIHIVTAGSSLTYQQPLNNIARGAIMALASVLGGTQSLGVSTYDEAMSVPSEHAHQMSLRIQQIIHHETNIPAVADPLGGSHYGGRGQRWRPDGSGCQRFHRRRDTLGDDRLRTRRSGLGEIHGEIEPGAARRGRANRGGRPARSGGGVSGRRQRHAGCDGSDLRRGHPWRVRGCVQRLEGADLILSVDRPGKVLFAKTALDGHWRGPAVVVHVLRDAGFEVIYLGMATADEIAAAVQEDADVVGLNVGGSLAVVMRILDELESRSAGG